MKNNGKLAILLACILLTGCGKGTESTASNSSVVSQGVNGGEVSTNTEGTNNKAADTKSAS